LGEPSEIFYALKSDRIAREQSLANVGNWPIGILELVAAKVGNPNLTGHPNSI
jgi:hypothetical protein